MADTVAPSMPAVMPVAVLDVSNAEYHGALIDKHDALYEGGERFRAQLDKFLVRRRIEESSVPGLNGSDIYRERAKWAQYVNRTGGLVDWFKAAVFPDTVRLEAEGGDDYWQSLTKNADGLGKPFAVVLREALVQMMSHFRAYLAVHFPAPVALPTRDDTRRPMMRSLGARRVIDWDYDYDELDDLDWVKLRDEQAVRATPFGAPDGELLRWTIATEREVAVYEAIRKKNAQPPATASLAWSLPHDLGICPVIDVRPYPGQWVLDRVSDVAISLYNAEAALSFAVMMQAYSQPVFKIDGTDLSRAVSHELAAIVLRPGEDFLYVAPNPKQFQAHFDNIERLKVALYEVVQALAINASSIPQAGRLSGQAVAEMRSPLETLIASFSWPVLDAARRWIDAVKRFRGEEDLEVRIEGLGGSRVAIDELLRAMGLGQVQSLVSVSGNEKPEAAQGGPEADEDDDDGEAVE
jgi:hypothetical protein